MPEAAYLLMALEAARQLSKNSGSNADSFGLSNVILERQLPLSVFSDIEAAVEAQLIAREMDAPNNFAFEIFLQTVAEGDTWAKHCSGNLETQNLVKPPLLNLPDQSHDQVLMNQAQILEPNIRESLSNLKLNPEGSSGDMRGNVDGIEDPAIDPSVFHSILRLPPMSLLSQNPLMNYRFSSLVSLTLSPRPHQSSREHFFSHVKPPELGFVESESEIHQFGNIMSLQGMRYQATKFLHEKPALDSLFFKPVLLPDITRLSNAKPMSISRCAQLLSHKWPSCDINIDDVPEILTVSVIEAFGAGDHAARSFFRSIKCSSMPPDVVSHRVQLVDRSNRSSRYHIIFTQDSPPLGQLSDHLHQGGFVCIPKAHMQGLPFNTEPSLEVVCDITELGSTQWVLLRQARIKTPVCTSRRIVIFANQRDLRSLNGFEILDTVPLEPDPVARFCERNSFPKFDAIIIDCPENPVITTWTGKQLMPWFHVLLKSAQSILWVTRNRDKKPYSNVAGGLLHTLQAEKPSLRISWLMTDEMLEKNQDVFAEQVEHAFLQMIDDKHELVRTAGQSGGKILRYLPDDCLSAYTGLSPSQEVRSLLGAVDYSLGVAARGEPIMLSHKASHIGQLSGDSVEVLLEASVIDVTDIHKFDREPNFVSAGSHSGLFFAGRVSDSQGPELPLNSSVVGWRPDRLHHNKVSSRSYDLCRYPSSMQPSQAASRYSAIAFASCIVDGVARARCGETFLLDIRGPLLNAVEQMCRSVGAIVLSLCSDLKADFVVTFDRLEGIRVNNKPLDLASYLHSDFGRKAFQRNWQGVQDLPIGIDEYEIANYMKAFINARQPCSAVLLHRNAAEILQHVPIYKKGVHMFRKDANYVVVGGLGGLGRFICQWMIENGARHITVISRSGAGAQESKDAISAMSASGACIRCIKADGCDRNAMSETLCKLRSERSVKGVINLAMVLGDAPLATMRPEEWDRVLRVKIQSSLILHEETLEDHLDFFILFSSIASVLGNRNQGNYNVANAALNALAEYRQSLDLPGISVALGAMSK